MHGLVLVDKDRKVLRNSIIWCDSRAVPYGEKAFDAIGHGKCLSTLLNSPGNFTAAKLAWVKDNEPHIYDKIYKFMLPGEYVAMRLTGDIVTTPSGLSEGIFWDFQKNQVSDELMNYFGFSKDFIADIRPTFSIQGELLPNVAKELGLKSGTPVSYRAGDQPNNALSLNVLNPGEIATTAGTSGVVYGISNEVSFDKQSRINTFAHVNHTEKANRLGVMACINGTGILNSWLKKNLAPRTLSYPEMNEFAAKSPIGSEGVVVLPFGNGAERVLCNREINSSINGVNFNIHTDAHVLRAAQEGIVFSFNYGMEIMKEVGINPQTIRAGEANMFLSPIFRETLAGVSGATIQLYETDGSVGAAKGAGIGAGIYKTSQEAFASLQCKATIEPNREYKQAYADAYGCWKEELERQLLR
jgi:xylulokinase